MTSSKSGSSQLLLNMFTGVFVAALVIVPAISSKFISVGPFVLSGATLIFPITYIFNDVLTEVYGYERSRQVIWTGMGCQILAAFSFFLVGIWPAAPFWHSQAAYDTILSSAPRITLASLSAYFCGEFANSVILSKLKFFQKGNRGWAQASRFVLSTCVGECIDSIVFMSIGFAGVLANRDLYTTIATIWVFKVLYEIVTLPFTTWFSNYVKRVEGVDHIDLPDRTSYNPFTLANKDQNA